MFYKKEIFFKELISFDDFFSHWKYDDELLNVISELRFNAVIILAIYHLIFINALTWNIELDFFFRLIFVNTLSIKFFVLLVKATLSENPQYRQKNCHLMKCGFLGINRWYNSLKTKFPENIKCTFSDFTAGRGHFELLAYPFAIPTSF